MASFVVARTGARASERLGVRHRAAATPLCEVPASYASTARSRQTATAPAAACAHLAGLGRCAQGVRQAPLPRRRGAGPTLHPATLHQLASQRPCVVLQALYYRARLYHTVGREDDKMRDAALFLRAEHEATQSAARLSGRLVDFADDGVLEEHIAQLQQLDTAAAAMYSGL